MAKVAVGRGITIVLGTYDVLKLCNIRTYVTRLFILSQVLVSSTRHSDMVMAT